MEQYNSPFTTRTPNKKKITKESLKLLFIFLNRTGQLVRSRSFDPPTPGPESKQQPPNPPSSDPIAWLSRKNHHLGPPIRMDLSR